MRPQYCSLNNPDPLGKIDTAGGLALARTQRVVTHLSLDTARVDPLAARNDPFLKNFVEDRFVEGFSLPREEYQRNGPYAAGPRARSGGTKAGRGLHRPSAQLRASSLERQNVPSSDRKTPAGPGPASCCATRSARRANGFSTRPGWFRFPIVRDRGQPVPWPEPARDRGLW